MIDPELLEGWAAMLHGIANEMEAVAAHQRIASRPSVVPQADYGSIQPLKVRPEVEQVLGRLSEMVYPAGPPPAAVVVDGQQLPESFTTSVRYPWGENNNFDVTMQMARRDYERGQVVFVQNKEGQWLEWGVDI